MTEIILPSINGTVALIALQPVGRNVIKHLPLPLIAGFHDFKRFARSVRMLSRYIIADSVSLAEANLAEFRARVVGIPSLIDQLQTAPDHESFVRSLVELGALHGFVFTGKEVQTALRGERRRRSERILP